MSETEADFIEFLEHAMREQAGRRLFIIEGLGLVWAYREADGSLMLRDDPDRLLTQPA